MLEKFCFGTRLAENSDAFKSPWSVLTRWPCTRMDQWRSLSSRMYFSLLVEEAESSHLGQQSLNSVVQIFKVYLKTVYGKVMVKNVIIFYL